ncbi:MAG: adenylate/guanylate cyclase domain-containing protein, partial [Candidatus Binatia bacterium]
LSPRTAGRIWRMSLEIDIRDILAAIRVPTLIVHTRGRLPARFSRYLVEHIEGARLVETDEQGPSRVSPGTDALDEIEEFLTGARPAPHSDRVLATVLFTDIVGSTRKAAELGDSSWRDLITQHDASVRRQIERFGGRLVETTGDGALATFDGPARGIRCAVAIRDALRALGLYNRAGLHTGEIELMGDGIGGIAVHIGARVQASAGAGEVLVSSTVKDLVIGSGIEFEDRGTHELRGVPGEWRLYAVTG